MISQDRCNGSCNNLENPSDRACVPSKIEDVNLNAFNIITRINESKRLTKYVSCNCR